jgi:hypothetical protein
MPSQPERLFSGAFPHFTKRRHLRKLRQSRENPLRVGGHVNDDTRTVRHTKDCPKCALEVFILTANYPEHRTRRQFSVRASATTRSATIRRRQHVANRCCYRIGARLVDALKGVERRGWRSPPDSMSAPSVTCSCPWPLPEGSSQAEVRPIRSDTRVKLVAAIASRSRAASRSTHGSKPMRAAARPAA